MSFTESSSRLIFLYRGMEDLNSEEKRYDLLLTPQFYTMKKEPLPVKYTYQASRVAPAMFEGLVEGEHHYFVFKEGDEWVFIAYNPSEIIDFLKSRHMPLEKLGKVFFAEQVASQIRKPIAMGEHRALALIEDSVTIVPTTALEESISFDDAGIKVPKKGVRIDVGTASIFPKKQLLLLSGVLFLFGAVWLAEGWRYGTSNQVLSTKIQQIYHDFPSLQSAYTRESVAKKYRMTDEVERKKRQMLGRIARVLSGKTKLQSLRMNKEGIEVTLSAPDIGTARRLEQLLLENGFTKGAASSGTTIVVEGKL